MSTFIPPKRPGSLPQSNEVKVDLKEEPKSDVPTPPQRTPQKKKTKYDISI